MRRSDKWFVVLLGILCGMIVFAVCDIERRGAGGDGSSWDDRGDELQTGEEHPNTPRNERDIQKARRDGTLRDGE